MSETEQVRKSVAAVSMHKAGSSIVQKKILAEITERNGFEQRLLAREAWRLEQSEQDYCVSEASALKPEGVFYGIFRGPYIDRITRLDELKVVAAVRDPRDCITSLYYSIVYSHSLPGSETKRKDFEVRRERSSEMSIDEFALGQINPRTSGNYVQRLRLMRQVVETHPDVLCVRYEKMVRRPETWLRELCRFLDFDLDAQLKRRITQIANFEPPQEDVYQHRRQVRPGDHKRKLKAETIDALSEAMREDLLFFGYEA